MKGIGCKSYNFAGSASLCGVMSCCCCCCWTCKRCWCWRLLDRKETKEVFFHQERKEEEEERTTSNVHVHTRGNNEEENRLSGAWTAACLVINVSNSSFPLSLSLYFRWQGQAVVVANDSWAGKFLFLSRRPLKVVWIKPSCMAMAMPSFWNDSGHILCPALASVTFLLLCYT